MCATVIPSTMPPARRRRKMTSHGSRVPISPEDALGPSAEGSGPQAGDRVPPYDAAYAARWRGPSGHAPACRQAKRDTTAPRCDRQRSRSAMLAALHGLARESVRSALGARGNIDAFARETFETRCFVVVID